METKEIEVFIISSDFEDNYKSTSIHWSKEEAESFGEINDILYTGKLVVNIPDKTVTITRADFLEAYNKARKNCTINRDDLIKELGL